MNEPPDQSLFGLGDLPEARQLASAECRLPPGHGLWHLGPDGLAADTRFSGHCLHEQFLPGAVRDAFDDRQNLGDEPGASFGISQVVARCTPIQQVVEVRAR